MSRITELARRETWAIDRNWLASNIASDFAAASRQPRLPKVDGTVAIIPMYGMITQRMSIWQEMFGGTSTQAFGAAYTRAVNDERLKAIVIDVDSPGGTVYGVEELSDIINQGSQIKTTVAIANSQMASAAYWLASQVGPGMLYATPGADVGSVGVFRLHEDVSAMMEKDGIKVEFISYPEYKTEGNPYEPLSADARAYNESQVRDTYERFASAVARGRRTTKKNVTDSYGKGRSLQAAMAKDVGMVDQIATLGQILAKMGVGTGKAQVGQVASNPIEGELCHAWDNLLPVAMHAKPDKTARERRLFLLTGKR